MNKPGEQQWRSLLVFKFTKRFKHSFLNFPLILYTVNYDLGDWKTSLLSLELLLQIIGLFILVLLLSIRLLLLMNMIKSSSETICIHFLISARVLTSEQLHYVLLEVGASNYGPGKGIHPFNLFIYHPSLSTYPSILPPIHLSTHLAVYLAINFWKA